MSEPEVDIKTLAEAFQRFTETTRTLEESYRRLENRLEDMDRELTEKNQELAVATDYLNSILEGMSDGVIAVDTHGIMTAFNRVAGEVLGYGREEAVGRSFSEVFGREFGAPPGHLLMELRAKDGRTISVSERDAPMADRNDERIGALKVFQDLTEIEALREKVQQKDRLAAIGEMAATVAHEIRNPLGGIAGFAALLARDITDDDPRHRLVEKILVGAKHLERVVNELLEYTRPVELRFRTVACSDIVDAALGYVELDGREVQIANAIAGDVLVMADPDKLRQVFLNILLNAVQSIDGSGEIRVTAGADEEAMVIAVSDTGCGMAPEQMGQVFSPFFTTKEKGTGLGLAVAAKIVEGHGGQLTVESEVGEGTVFRVHLPRAE